MMSRSIKPLPEAVHSSVRSGSVLFDLTRVVEELVFNSVDAGASKVFVAVCVTTCYVKVVDNGSGITRDGLKLLGERYVTSKLEETDGVAAASEGFGFRGEALSSISDVSLLEIVTKSHGRPNGYRKVMKGRKCLYLGIDDEIRDVGTTVIVRDLFYNQPVRRKHMQSSPKKVLHLVKESVLRIALVKPKVLFKVIDIESEDELLRTYPSPSPLSLLTSSFGFDVSSNLYELNVFDGELKLSGYISAPCDTYSVKAFQYIYINSRYISKGPLHKLLNHLAMGFSSSDWCKASNGSPCGKRSRSQTYATCILNLSCPHSCYALTFEPSKTSVEFKDWVPILDFVERSITHLWTENHGDSVCHDIGALKKDEMPKEDLPAKQEVTKKRCRNQIDQASFCPHPSQLAKLTEDSGQMSHWEGNCFPYLKSQGNTSKFREDKTLAEFGYQVDHPVHTFDKPLTQCQGIAKLENDSLKWVPDVNIFSTEDSILGSKFSAREKSSVPAGNVSGIGCEDDYLNDFDNASNGVTRTANGMKFGRTVNKVSRDLEEPFMHNCSSQSSFPPDATLFESDEISEFQNDVCRGKEKHYKSNYYKIVDDGNKNFDFLPKTSWEDETTIRNWPSSCHLIESDLYRMDLLSRDALKLSPVGGECSLEENGLLRSPTRIGKYRNRYQSFDSEWSCVTPDPLFRVETPDVDQFTPVNTLSRRSSYDDCAGHIHWAGKEENESFLSCYTPKNYLSQGNWSLSICTNSRPDFKGHAGAKKDFGGFLHDLDDGFFSECSSPCNDKIGSSSTVCVPKSPKSRAVSNHFCPTSVHLDKDLNHMDRHMDQEENYGCERGPIRSHSAPPVYRGRKRFAVVNNLLTIGAGKPNIQTFNETFTFGETCDLKHLQPSSIMSHLHPESSSGQDLSFNVRRDMTSDMIEPEEFKMKIKSQHLPISNVESLREPEEFKMKKKSQHLPISNVESLRDFASKEPIREEFMSGKLQDQFDSGTKWRNNCPQISNGDSRHNCHDEDPILDISSGILHLAGESLVPKSINKNFLEGAQVLQQVDKKFIPVVSGGVLAVIDQHAADERIRLEELRQKVLCGEMKTIAYLDDEQELVLPEIGHQLLHNYAEQIQNWGWIYNIHAQKSFKKNLNLLNKQQSGATLLAVPCILGVNLTDVDLLEFLQQLADTDGSSTVPPSVLRVLNFKACRGAIMFGDTLLPSECSLIVEELKQTSLCFQCAHGRPTTAPLVNLGALRKQIAKAGLWNVGNSNELWHGLYRHEISLERAASRLNLTSSRC